jgi:hypothetical protein
MLRDGPNAPISIFRGAVVVHPGLLETLETPIT